MMETQEAPQEDNNYELVCNNSRLKTQKAKSKRLYRKTDKSRAIIEDSNILLTESPRKINW